MTGTPKWVVTGVTPKEDYTLHLTFADGSRRVFNAKPLLTKAIYSDLTNIPFFMKAYADGCSVAWSDDVDIAPEYLYEASSVVA